MKAYMRPYLLLGLASLQLLAIVAANDYFLEVEGSGEGCDPGNPWVGECPVVDDVVPTFLQHASSCNKYFVCNHGRATLMLCPAGLDFNVVLSACDSPVAAGCEIGEYFPV